MTSAVRRTDLRLFLDFSPAEVLLRLQRAGQVPGGGPAGPEGVDLVAFERAEAAVTAERTGLVGEGPTDSSR